MRAIASPAASHINTVPFGMRVTDTDTQERIQALVTTHFPDTDPFNPGQLLLNTTPHFKQPECQGPLQKLGSFWGLLKDSFPMMWQSLRLKPKNSPQYWFQLSEFTTTQAADGWFKEHSDNNLKPHGGLNPRVWVERASKRISDTAVLIQIKLSHTKASANTD